MPVRRHVRVSDDSDVGIREAPDTEHAWREFHSRLAATLDDLDEDEYLVVYRKRSNYFVQFYGQGIHGMRVEAVSNEFLEEAAMLPPAACEHLIQLGLHLPTYLHLESLPEPADGSPNFYLDAGAPVPFAAVAALAIDALRGVYGVRHPGELEYSAESLDGASIRFPLLGLRRRPPDKSPRA
jgi:hypothetical protein